MSRLVVAANRGPYALRREDDGSLSAMPGGGGLAPSLASAIQHGQASEPGGGGAGSDGRAGDGEAAVWVAAPMNELEREAAASGGVGAGGGLELSFVGVDEQTYAAAYDVVANSTLWFLVHGLFEAARRPLFDLRWREAWEGFRRYNAAFADLICESASDGATVLVNDYHLPLVGRMLAERRGDLSTVHFTHTPFATRSEVAMLPRDVRRELLEGMTGFGACGFHTDRWKSRFDRAVGAFCETETASFSAGLGADPERLAEAAASGACAERLARLEERVADRQVIFRSDRVELSKNILRGFLALDALLEERPRLRGRVVMVARAYASREGLADYLAYRSEVEHLAALLNERWALRCGGEAPIELLVEDDFPASVAGLRRYDVLLVNPVRDGMNLVAKEGPVVNERDGVLVLSEEAGAYDELSDVALGVQPFDVADTAAALARALEMPAYERRRRAAELRRRAAANPPAAWFSDVLARARRTSTSRS